MKIKIIAILGLSSFLLLGACKGDSNTNTNVNKMNTNAVVVAPTVAAPAKDTATESAVMDALKKKGYTDVTVDATTTQVTLRGSVAKGKMGEAVQTAQEAGKKPVKNELSEK